MSRNGGYDSLHTHQRRGLTEDETEVSDLLLAAANQVTGVLSPAFGPLGDRWGYRRMMLAGSAMFAVGMLCGGLALVCLVWGLRSFHFSEPIVY